MDKKTILLLKKTIKDYDAMTAGADPTGEALAVDMVKIYNKIRQAERKAAAFAEVSAERMKAYRATPEGLKRSREASRKSAARVNLTKRIIKAYHTIDPFGIDSEQEAAIYSDVMKALKAGGGHVLEEVKKDLAADFPAIIEEVKKHEI